MPIRFSSPFSTQTDVRELVDCCRIRDRYLPIKESDVAAAGKALREASGDLRSHLRTIYIWKLGAFLHFDPEIVHWPNNVPDECISEALLAARVARVSDTASVKRAIEKLRRLPGVGFRVASTILMALQPEEFTIADKQAYKALNAKYRDSFDDYLAYLAFCKSEATRLNVTLREHDQALWQHGVFLGRNARRRM